MVLDDKGQIRTNRSDDTFEIVESDANVRDGLVVCRIYINCPGKSHSCLTVCEVCTPCPVFDQRILQEVRMQKAQRTEGKLRVPPQDKGRAIMLIDRIHLWRMHRK